MRFKEQQGCNEHDGSDVCFYVDKLMKQRSTGSSSKSVPLTWVDVLSLPLPTNKDGGHTKRDKDEEQHR